MLFLLIPFIFLGCLENPASVEPKVASSTTTTKAASATILKVAWPSNDWTEAAKIAVAKHINVEQEIKDAKEYCPKFDKFSKSEKESFFVSLISIMSKYESSFRPETIFRECKKDKCIYGKCVQTKYGFCMPGSKFDEGIAVSRGLLQISIESAKGYDCPVNDPKELNDPKVNIDCGARILGRWVGRDKRISGNGPGDWKGGARYWSVLRSTSSSQPKIQNWTRELCK